jgi:hypothetical protein
MRELPLACSLSGADQALRLTEMASLSERVAGVEHTDGRRATLRFRADAETRTRLREIVEAERECCAFLDLSLSDRGPELRLSIVGPEGAEPTIAEIVGAFCGAGPAAGISPGAA